MTKHETIDVNDQYRVQITDDDGNIVAGVAATEMQFGGAKYVEAVEIAVKQLLDNTSTERFPDPSDAVDAVDDPEADRGVRLDTLIEARSEARSARSQLSDAYVDLDSVADDRGLYPEQVQREMRFAQRSLLPLMEWLGVFSYQLEYRVEAVMDDDD